MATASQPPMQGNRIKLYLPACGWPRSILGWIFAPLLVVLASIGLTTTAQADPEDYSTQVHTLYIGYFGRPPGPDGLTHYQNQMLQSNGNYLILIDDFWNSAERQQHYAGLSLDAQIDAIFNQLFGRNAAMDGRRYWAGLVQRGTITLPEIAYTVAYNASAADLAVLNARRAVSQTLTARLTGRQATYAVNLPQARSLIRFVSDRASEETVQRQLDPILANLLAGDAWNRGLDTETMPGLTDIVWHVDDDNTTGNQSGTAQYPYASIQAAIAAADYGDTIKVARGAYGPIDSQGKALNLQGGYPGATSAAYQAGQGGDFATPSLGPEATVIAGNQVDPAVRFTRFDDRPHFVRIDRFAVRQGGKGIVCDKDQSWPHPDNLTISNNIIEDNGQADDSSHGAGILICGERATIRDNLIRRNQGGKGPGIHGASWERLLVTDNRIEDNIAYEDHGGGLYLTGPMTLSHNVVAGNRIAWGYGWGGGIIIFNPEGDAQLYRNIIRDNWAPSYGGGIFIDDGARATLSHNLIYRNRTAEGIGGGVAVDDGYEGASQVTLNHCTIAFNNADAQPDPWAARQGGNALFIEGGTHGSSATVTNSIVWGNGVTDFFAADASTLSVSYSLLGQVWPGVGNFSADPLFANPDAGDFHLRARAGRWDPVAATWVTDTTDSPALDTADPLAPFGNETSPNGGRANLGAYGNTAEASRSGSTIGAGPCGAEAGQLFGADHPWNQPIDGAPLDAESAAIIGFLQARHTSSQRFRIDGPSDEPNNTYGLTLLRANAATPRESFLPTVDHYHPDCDTAPVPIPPGGAIEGERGYACDSDGDCHLLVLDGAACTLHEMWRADRRDSVFAGGCLAVWDLNQRYTSTLRGDCCTSADAAGLPIAPLTFNADEIAAGEIRHAIRFVLPNALIRERIYVRPATHATSATQGPGEAPPYGARLRLKAGFDMSRLSAPAQVVARAMQRYGMILADGGSLTFTALNDRFTAHTWAEVGFGPNALTALQWSDFEVVELGQRYRWDSACDCQRVPLAR